MPGFAPGSWVGRSSGNRRKRGRLRNGQRASVCLETLTVAVWRLNMTRAERDHSRRRGSAQVRRQPIIHNGLVVATNAGGNRRLSENAIGFAAPDDATVRF